MSPFPTELPERLQVHPIYPDIASAYAICVRLQKKIQEQNDPGKDTTKIIYCRVLGHLFNYAPTDQAIETIVYEVVSAEDDEALLKLGEMYLNNFIRPCKSSECLPDVNQYKQSDLTKGTRARPHLTHPDPLLTNSQI